MTAALNTSAGDCRTQGELCALVASGVEPEFLFFWGHTPTRPGVVDQSCLSQWAPFGFRIENVHYPTAEHFMMASKARFFDDEATLKRILACEQAGDAKKLGREVRGFNDAEWKAARFDFVVRGNVAKFGQSQALRQYLVGTGACVLVEASPRDRIWGIGLGKSSARATQPAQWNGLNLLGFALMEARAQLSA